MSCVVMVRVSMPELCQQPVHIDGENSAPLHAPNCILVNEGVGLVLLIQTFDSSTSSVFYTCSYFLLKTQTQIQTQNYLLDPSYNNYT